MEVLRMGAGMGVSAPVRLGALGVGLWAVGVVSAHFAAPLGVFTPSLSILLLLATLPMAWLTVRLVGRVGAYGPARVVEAVALTSMPALLLDGLAFTAAPDLYSVHQGEQVQAAAWLLWFVGVSLAIAAFRASRQPD